MSSKTGYALLGILVAAIIVIIIVFAVRGSNNDDVAVNDGSVQTLDRGSLSEYDRDELTITEAQVDTVDVVLQESFPVQATAVVSGSLRNGCEEIYEVLSRRDGNTFMITLNAAQPTDAVCTQVVRPYEESFPLDVAGLTAGTYTVTVNGVSTTFTLDADNVVDFAENALK